jgi:hypothetical protein
MDALGHERVFPTPRLDQRYEDARKEDYRRWLAAQPLPKRLLRRTTRAVLALLVLSPLILAAWRVVSLFVGR